MTIEKLFSRSDKDIKIYVNYRRRDIRIWWDKQFLFTSGPEAREFFDILDIQHGFCTIRRKIKKKIPLVLILPAASGGGVAYILKGNIRLRISWDWNVNNIDVSRCLVENF